MSKDASPKRELSSSALNDFSACSLTPDSSFCVHSVSLLALTSQVDSRYPSQQLFCKGPFRLPQENWLADTRISAATSR